MKPDTAATKYMQLCICIVHGMVDKTIELACMHVCCDRSVGGQKIEFKTVVNLHFDQNTLPERDKNKIPSSGSQTVKLYANSNVRNHRNVQILTGILLAALII